LKNVGVYGQPNSTPPKKDWAFVTFLDSKMQLCCTCFHSASFGALVQLVNTFDYTGKKFSDTKVRFEYDPVAVKGKRGNYYKLSFKTENTTPISEAEKEAINAFAADYPFEYLPARHIIKALTENEADALSISDMLNLTEPELGYITEYATRIDTTTGAVETPAAILQLNAKN